MSEKIYRCEVRFMIRADDKLDAAQKIAAVMAAGVDFAGIAPLFAIAIDNDEVKPDEPKAEPESPKAEDVFGRIMSAPDVQ
jgi:hypothetical protein